MKFSEGLFKFPVKIYDPFSVTKAILKEDKHLTKAESIEDIEDLVPESSDWVMGYAKIPIREIKAWTDIFEEGESVKEVAEKGFQQTMVITNTLGNFECLWPMAKFEQELDEFAEKYTKGIDKMVEDAMAEKAQRNEYAKKEKRPWLGWG